MDPKCDREVTLYGWLRGCNMKPGARVHLAGVGDFSIQVGGSRGHEGAWWGAGWVMEGLGQGVVRQHHQSRMLQRVPGQPV